MLVSIPLPSVILLPCFKYNPLPREPNPLPLYGLKYTPWPSVSTCAIIPPFLRYNPLPNNLLTPVDANPERHRLLKLGPPFLLHLTTQGQPFDRLRLTLVTKLLKILLAF